MILRAIDVYRAIVHQGSSDISELDPDARGKAVADFAEFVMSDSVTEAAGVLTHLLRHTEIEPWDETWAIPEVARATLDALEALKSVAATVLERLVNSDDETIRELRYRLAEASKPATAVEERQVAAYRTA